MLSAPQSHFEQQLLFEVLVCVIYDSVHPVVGF